MLDIKLKFCLSSGLTQDPFLPFLSRYSGYKFYVYPVRMAIMLLHTNICNCRNYIVSFSLWFYLHKCYHMCVILQLVIFTLQSVQYVLTYKTSSVFLSLDIWAAVLFHAPWIAGQLASPALHPLIPVVFPSPYDNQKNKPYPTSCWTPPMRLYHT